MSAGRIGIIGGSGVYDFEGIEYFDEVQAETPFGNPSDAIRLGRYEGRELAFLPRHGRGHKFNPTNVPYRANIYAMKKLGVDWIIALNAVGSLCEEMKPLDFTIPDQIIDRTRSRVGTFFDPIAVHVGFADPYCETLRGILIEAVREVGVTVHEKGTYVCMEGPLFSTRAESNLYRSWGGNLIGMTTIPEAKLAMEAEIGFATIAAVTDYDCWHESDDVDIQMVIEYLGKNAENLKRAVMAAIPKIPVQPTDDPCFSALRYAVLTQRENVPESLLEAYDFLTKPRA